MDFLKTINAAGWVTMILMIASVWAIGQFIPAGPGHDLLMGAIGAIGAQTITSTRTPSNDGGTTKSPAP